MSDIIQNISEIIFLASGKFFPFAGGRFGHLTKMSCSEKSNAVSGLCGCLQAARILRYQGNFSPALKPMCSYGFVGSF